ncbi:host nuclease inhibitor protein [Pseudomonas sp. B111]|uniref:host nuclease inhibitor protein n=1 Tax=Pseudomonas sp. B111 TaxID=2944252 RepID=UPI002264671E|nr:host nuclease inhibitor protein [Pseudomonas sp. B111]UZX36780.1 host nuclease inhibitor protein [Pseudomonas sp. B111]
MAITIEQIMDQAQVYASAWSMVGGPFDQGNQLLRAHEEKQLLEEMLGLFQEQTDMNAAPGNMKEIAEGLVQWHQNRLGNLDKMINATEGTQVCLGVDDANPTVLDGELHKVWRLALRLARLQFEKFPLSIERTAPASDEEE